MVADHLPLVPRSMMCWSGVTAAQVLLCIVASANRERALVGPLTIHEFVTAPAVVGGSISFVAGVSSNRHGRSHGRPTVRTWARERGDHTRGRGLHIPVGLRLPPCQIRALILGAALSAAVR